MNEMKDRRTFDRLMVPEISALLRNTTWYYFLIYKLFQSIALFRFEKNLIQNLSASGLCILSNINFESGKMIYLILYSPGVKNMLIKGTVRWISSDAGNNLYYAGIQFLAFGHGKKYNSYEVLDQLHTYTLQNTRLAER